MLNQVHAIIFTNQDYYDLRELTEIRSVSSVPYGGRYRMIDFILSNCVNAGINEVGVILQQNYQSLLDHIGSGKDWDLARRRGGLRLLPPFSQKASGSGTPRGRLESLINLGSYIDDIRQDYVILADGDLAINIDLREVFNAHISSGADVTCVVTPHYTGSPKYTTYFTTDENGKMDILHHPDEAVGYEGLNLFIMSKKLLAETVKHAAARGQVSLVRDGLIPNMDKWKIEPYVFDGYSARLTSVPSYFARSMDLLNPDVRKQLFDPAHPIYSKDRTDAATYYAPGSSCKNSIVSDGCIIEGTVENSIIFRNVRIAKGSVVKNSILMKGTTVGENSSINCIIADKSVSISANSVLAGHENYPLLIAKGSKV